MFNVLLTKNGGKLSTVVNLAEGRIEEGGVKLGGEAAYFDPEIS